MKARKWFIAIIVILIIAAVLTVVFINLFKEKDTNEGVNNVHNYVQNGFLNKETHENEIARQYLGLIASSEIEVGEEDHNIASNAITALDAFEIYGSFFDRQIIYTTYTQVYRDNRKAMADNLSDAQRYMNTLKDYLDANLDNMLSTDPSVKNSWLVYSWNICSSYVTNFVTCTANAMTRLGTIYTSCVTSPLMNNALTKAVFAATANITAKLGENLKTQGYTQTYKAIADAYLAKDKTLVILDVEYNEELQAKLEKILAEDGQNTEEYQQLLAGTLA